MGGSGGGGGGADDGGTEQRGKRQARVPQRLLVASASVLALAVALLALAAAGTGHTELRLSAGVQLSIGRLRATIGDVGAGHLGAATDGAVTDDVGAATGGESGGTVAQHTQAAPPLPAEEPPPPFIPEEEEDAAYDDGNTYAQADMLTLLGDKPAGRTAGGGAKAGGGGGGGSKPAGGSTAKFGAGKAVVTSAGLAARDSGVACGEALYIKKVALLFLTTKRLAHEKLWRLWLWDAAGLVPQQALPLVQEAVCGPDASAEAGWQRVQSACAGVAQVLDAATKGGAAATLLPPQHLFSVYVHAPPEYKGLEYQPLFQGRLIPTRVKTSWGSGSIMEAERALLRAALSDPLNDRFVLLSDSDVPLYDPLTFYQQLMHEARSRVRACAWAQMSAERWKDGMASARLKKHHWRKSSQFFGLTKRHAELVVSDVEVFRAFKERCGGWYSSSNQWMECVPDEHYIPTLLASLGLENETYCAGYGLAWVDWSEHGMHPRSYMPKDVSPGLVKKMRWSCENQRQSGEDAERMFMPVTELLAAGTPQRACQKVQAAGGSAGGAESLGGNSTAATGGGGGTFQAHSYAHPIDGACPLTARKFPAFAAQRVRQLFLTSCPGAGMQVASKAAQTFALGRDPDVTLLRGTACKAAVQRMTVQQAGRRRRRRRRRGRRRRRVV